jgi:hypothetical protein
MTQTLVQTITNDTPEQSETLHGMLVAELKLHPTADHEIILRSVITTVLVHCPNPVELFLPAVRTQLRTILNAPRLKTELEAYELYNQMPATAKEESVPGSFAKAAELGLTPVEYANRESEKTTASVHRWSDNFFRDIAPKKINVGGERITWGEATRDQVVGFRENRVTHRRGVDRSIEISDQVLEVLDSSGAANLGEYLYALPKGSN